MKDSYPGQVCSRCALRAGGHHPGHEVTWWQGRCDVCGIEMPVTAPRDFGYPKFDRIPGKRAEARP